MASLKVDSFVMPFRGKAGESWQLFWEKFQVLADVQGWDTEEKVMKNFPLFLDSDALLVYDRMSADDKKKKAEVCKVMTQSFSLTKSAAYSAFVTRRLRPDESVDAYVADLERLAALSGHSSTGDKDAVIVLQLISGLPPEFCREVRLGMAGKEMTVSGCLDLVRALKAAESDLRAQAAGVSAATVASSTASGGRSNVLCYRCHQMGHMRKDCPQARGDHRKPQGDQPRPGGKKIVCFFCDGEGHTKAECPERKAWMASGKKQVAVAPDVLVASPNVEQCLCTVAVPGGLPRIYVDVAKVVDGSPTAFARARAVIDTGSNRTLISQCFAEALGINFSSVACSNIVALDGNPLMVVGIVPVLLERLDGPVSLPRITVNAYVVADLSVVRADVLVGNDVAIGSGGLH